MVTNDYVWIEEALKIQNAIFIIFEGIQKWRQLYNYAKVQDQGSKWLSKWTKFEGLFLGYRMDGYVNYTYDNYC